MLIDVTRLLSRAMQGRLPTGVDRVGLAYVEHFADRAAAMVRFGGRWVELSQRDSRTVFTALLQPDGGFKRAIRWCVGRSYALRWQDMGGSRVFLNTGHSGLDEDSYPARVRKINVARSQRLQRLDAIPAGRRGLQPVFFIHDIIPITHPEYCRPGEADEHRRRLENMVSVGRGLIMNSQATRAALEGYAGKAGWELPPCVVAPLAATPLPQAGALPPLSQPYFVVLGTIEPRKNHLLLLHLWRQLVHELGDAAPRLVLIGQRGWECEQVIDLLDRCEALRGIVIERQDCGDKELSTWLRHTRALLFPSFTEGFGIPLIEALGLGVPVIASDLGVFREIAGDIPDYLDPLDGHGWKRAVLDYMDDDSLRRRSQRERMQGYSAFDWERHFAIVEAFMNGLIDRGR